MALLGLKNGLLLKDVSLFEIFYAVAVFMFKLI